MGLARTVLLRASESARLRDLFQRRGLARAAVARFMPGETLESALEALRGARAAGLGGVLTHLGENLREAGEADAVLTHYLHVLDAVEAAGLDAHVSVKLTQLGLDTGIDEAARRVAPLAERAAGYGRPLWIDMEGSAYTERTLRLYRDLLPQHPNLGVCLQAYLRRTAADVEDLLARRGRIRLVKGAYQEPPSIAFPRKQDVDEAFFTQALALARDGAAGGPAHAIATHDLPLIDRIRAVAAASRPANAPEPGAAAADRGSAAATAAGAAAPSAGAAAHGWELHMLFGIKPEAQRRLAAEGVRVRVLVSYGEYWYPWFVRRLAERPANVLFVVKALIG